MIVPIEHDDLSLVASLDGNNPDCEQREAKANETEQCSSEEIEDTIPGLLSARFPGTEVPPKSICIGDGIGNIVQRMNVLSVVADRLQVLDKEFCLGCFPASIRPNNGDRTW
jgi:hypothetical protein